MTQTTVKISGYYEVATIFVKGGKEIQRASFIHPSHQEEGDVYLFEGEVFDGVISYPRPTENELRGDSAVPLYGYNIFGRRAYYPCPRQYRRNRG